MILDSGIHILDQMSSCRRQFALLIDPEKINHAVLTAQLLSYPDYIFVGGSTGDQSSTIVQTLQELTTRPVVLFPGNVGQFSPMADALLLPTLMNTSDPQLLLRPVIGMAQVIRQSDIETIPMGYILIDGGRRTAVQEATKSKPYSPQDVSGIVSAAIAAELLGKRVVYLEAGSGALNPVDEEIITSVRAAISLPLIVGGGICTLSQMRAAYDAGADIVVIGNHFEQHPEQIITFYNNIPI